MSDDRDEIVRVAAGELVDVEIWQGVLADAGIDARVVGGDLTAGLGTAIPGSVELWVHRGDADRAGRLLREAEEQREPSEPEA